MTTIVLYGLRESLRRKMFAVVLVLTLLFLSLYAWGTHAAFKDTQNFVPRDQLNLNPDRLAGAIVFGLAMFATLFLGAVLAVFLTLNVVRGDTEAGLLQPLVVRPIGRTQLLLARFAGAAGVCVAYVLAVYFASVGITYWAGGWTPDRLVAPGVELAAAIVVVSAIALAGSVFLSPIANGIGTLMIFGAGLMAGLLGEIGHAINSHLLSEVELVCDHVVIVDHGRVVAAGTPDELRRQGGVEIETATGTRRFADARRDDVPRLVRELVAAGEEIYEVRVVASSLEDVYLEVVD